MYTKIVVFRCNFWIYTLAVIFKFPRDGFFLFQNAVSIWLIKIK